MKIPRKYAPLLFVLIMSILMSFLMSLIITFINLGMVSNFVPLWLKAWGFAFIVSFPIVTLVVPITKKFVSAITR